MQVLYLSRISSLMPENRRQALHGHQETSATVMLLAPKTVTASNLTHVVFRVSKCTYVGNTRKRFLIVQCKKPGREFGGYTWGGASDQLQRYLGLCLLQFQSRLHHARLSLSTILYLTLDLSQTSKPKSTKGQKRTGTRIFLGIRITGPKNESIPKKLSNRSLMS